MVDREFYLGKQPQRAEKQRNLTTKHTKHTKWKGSFTANEREVARIPD
jgi:hypothetical protein